MSRLEVQHLSLQVAGRWLLSEVDFAAEAGECVAVLGPSGVGKTSLLNCLAGISVPSSGCVLVDGTDLTGLSAAKRADFRLRHIGMVFQFGELLPELTVLENVAMPLRLTGVPRRAAEGRAKDWLRRLALQSRVHAHSDVLSGGEIQRAGIARALVPEPLVVLADEPTGMLDEQNTRRVAGLLVETAHEVRATVVVTTHDPVVAHRADRVVQVHDGRLVSMDERSSLASS